MNDLKAQIEKNRRYILIGLAALMFIFFALISAAKGVNGFQVAFKGEGFGFARFLVFILILLPLVTIVDEFINFKAKLPAQLKDNFGTCIFGLGLIIAILYAICLPSGAFGWGTVVYIILALLGVAVCNINKILK